MASWSAMKRGLASSRWAILQLRLVGPFVVLQYTDSLGKRERFTLNPPALPPSSALLPTDPLTTPYGLSSLVQELARGLPDARPGPHNTGPVPVALFVSSPPLVELRALDEEINKFASGLLPDANRLQVVTLSRSKPLPRSPFRLPFRILAVGPAAGLALSQLARTWHFESEVAQGFGLHIALASGDVESALREAARDIVLTEDARPLLASADDLPERSRPRLVIFLDRDFLQPARLRVPPGVALLRLPPPSFGQSVAAYVSSFVHGLIHDLPLHEAVKAAGRQVVPIFTPDLIADPVSNESLRILEALAELKRQRERLEARLPSLSIGPLLDRLRESSDPAVQRLVPGLAIQLSRLEPPPGYVGYPPFPELAELKGWIEDTRRLPAEFTSFEQEGRGLVPMASMEADFARLRATEPVLREKLRFATENAEVARVLRQHQKRVVDVALSRLETQPVLEPVGKFTTLAAGAAYQLRVHIGNPLPDSIVSGPTPPIDPLLPDPDDARGHRLEVAVQGKDFQLLTARSQALWLPEFGGSEPVYFEVRAPERPSAAELRICLYHRNHLIQSYVLSAEVITAEVTADRREPAEARRERLSVRLEFSRTERFTNLEELTPRLLSLGVNLAVSSATHKLIVKADNADGELTLFPSTYSSEVKKFRDVLGAAAVDPVNPTLPRVYPMVAVGQAPAADVQETFRDFMRKGSDLYDAVFNKAARASSALRKALVRVKQTGNQKLQVVRFDDNFVFPWALLYDFALPDDIYGQAQPPICLGIAVDAAGAPTDCAHTYRDKVFCVRGFWGVRHYAEELIGQGTSVDPKVDRTAQDAIRIVADSTLASASSLVQNLGTAIGGGLVVSGPTDPDVLADLMWKDPPERPSILIVLGHLETQLVVGEPSAPRIVLVPQSKWLTRKLIADRVGGEAEGWKQPRSVIMLMVCESAATTVDTVNDFVTAWNTAGAGAIVGTETVVGSALAAEFAEDVTRRLWNQEPLGEAMTAVRRRLIGQGNPLAFIFHAIGDTDLTVK